LAAGALNTGFRWSQSGRSAGKSSRFPTPTSLDAPRSIGERPYPQGMLRVYLDENKWIDLARAVHGHPLGERYKTAAMMIAVAVDRGEASFPLSAGHMFETWKQKRGRRRHDVATTMLTISRNHAIAPHWELVPGEIDRALRRRFGRPVSCLPVRPFGRGIAHRSGRYAPPIPERLRARCRAELEPERDR
jgi:hypothetical protein